MTISAKIIADSISEQGIRLTTMQLRYPRFIHAEFMTHRVFSRNASSSRAIPVERLIDDIVDDTAMPIHWGKNQAGMQAKEEHFGQVKIGEHVLAEHLRYKLLFADYDREDAWMRARDYAIEMAHGFHIAGYHKQIVNRLLEPFSHINVVVTASTYSNFFALRDHPDAQPEIMALAQQMKLAMDQSMPDNTIPGQWHLPYVPHWERDDIVSAATGKHPLDLWDANDWAAMIKVSVARCARVSYLTHDGKKPDIASDLALYDRLLASVPLHASPAEHQATPDTGAVCYDASNGPDQRKPFFQWNHPEHHGNLNGWIQFRKTLANENQ